MTNQAFTATATAFGALMLAATMAHAEVVVLDTVTVTGTRNEKTVFENPRSISVVTQQEIEKKAPESVAEILRDVPGVQILDSSVAGMKRVVIRGESSERNVILIDGQEITDHSTYGTPLLIDPATIERIEVVKGPASVLYGSKAIGGVINIITKKGGDKPVEGIFSNTYFSATRGFHHSATVLGSWKNWDYRLTGSLADHGDRRVPGGTLPNSDFSNNTVSGHIGYRHENHYFAFKAEQYNLKSDSYVDPAEVGFPITAFDLELPKRDRSKVAFFYDGTDITPWLKKVHFDAYFQTIDRVFEQNLSMVIPPTSSMTLGNTSDDKGETKGATLQFDIQPFNNHTLIFGGQLLDDNLKTVKTSVTTILPVPGFPITTVNVDDANIRTYSVFAQDEWSLTDSLKLTAGARYYHVDAKLKASNHAALSNNSDDHIVGSVGLTYSGVPNTILRALASQGYVYPTLLQLFVDTPFGGGGTTFGNPDLKPETSNNFEIGARYSAGGLAFDAAAFYTIANDYIARRTTSGLDGTWMNVNKATTFGAELFAEYRTGWTGNLTPYVNAAWTRRKFETATYSTYHTFRPALTGRAGVKFDWELNELVGGWGDLYMRGATKTKLEDDTGITDTAGGWATLNLALGIEVGEEKNIQFALNFNNITNKSYTPANEIQAPGRSVELTSRIKF